jgi:hypothetical protein
MYKNNLNPNFAHLSLGNFIIIFTSFSIETMPNPLSNAQLHREGYFLFEENMYIRPTTRNQSNT